MACTLVLTSVDFLFAAFVFDGLNFWELKILMLDV